MVAVPVGTSKSGSVRLQLQLVEGWDPLPRGIRCFSSCARLAIKPLFCASRTGGCPKRKVVRLFLLLRCVFAH
jgi:hypothetical protein